MQFCKTKDRKGEILCGKLPVLNTALLKPPMGKIGLVIAADAFFIP